MFRTLITERYNTRQDEIGLLSEQIPYTLSRLKSFQKILFLMSALARKKREGSVRGTGTLSLVSSTSNRRSNVTLFTEFPLLNSITAVINSSFTESNNWAPSIPMMRITVHQSTKINVCGRIRARCSGHILCVRRVNKPVLHACVEGIAKQGKQKS